MKIISIIIRVLLFAQFMVVESTLRRPTIVTYPQVEISTGTLRGLFGTSRDGREFYQFLSIPYGEAPIGDLRFQEPVPARKWKGVRRAEKHRLPCLQLNFITGLISGAEDCLYLSVFVPNVASEPSLSYELNRNIELEGDFNDAEEGRSEVNPEEILVELRGNGTNGGLLPVIVYIYGGYFMYGSARRYGPEYFMDENVILVTFNYRVGALGFLNTGDGAIKGNMGLKDQVFVLKWIQSNIAYFGGDPNKVILMGESAGGTNYGSTSSVHYHILSKMSSGLFHKAISQSGSAIRTWQLTYRPVEQAKYLATQLNCSTITPNEMIRCLKNVEGIHIVSTHYERINVLANPLSQFSPTLERIDGEGQFMTRHPLEVLKSGDFNHVPWLVGINKDEGLIYSARIIRNKNVISRIDTDWQNVAPILLNYNADRTEVASQVLNFYFDTTSPIDFQKNFDNFTTMFTDRFYMSASRFSALEHANYAPVYAYYFTYEGSFSFYNIFVSGSFPRFLELGYSVAKNWVTNKVRFLKRRQRRYGVCHADDLVMFFNLGYLTKIKRQDADYEMSRAMIAAWTNFAKDHENLRFQHHQWLPISSKDESPLYMNLNTINGGLIREPFTARAKFWESRGIIL